MEEVNDIPQTIRDQIGSGKIIATIDSINERTDIARLDIIPQLVYDVLSKDVPAKDFVSHCSKQFRFSEKKLKAVVREIKEKILKQFDYALLNYGVDIKEIDVSDAMTLDEYTKQHNEMLASVGIEVEKPVSTISLENFSDTEPQDFIPVKINVDGSVDNTSKKIEVSDEPAPLVIHREKPQAPTQGGGSSQQTRGFSLPFGFFKQKVVQTQAPSTPVRATIEFLKKDGPKRAVDYNELRTPLTPFSKKEEGFIQAEKIQNPNSQFQTKPETQNLKIESQASNNPPNADKQPIVQKINPLMMFGGGTANNKNQVVNKGVLDIRTSGINDKQLKTENLRENVKTPSVFDNKQQTTNNIKPTPVVPQEIKKQPTIDVQKNIIQPTKSASSAVEQKSVPDSSTQGARTPVAQGPTQNSQTPPQPKPFSAPEKPKTPIVPIINNAPKQNVPIEQKKESTTPPTSGKGFVWFKKPAQKTITMTNDDNTDKSPKVSGNTIDLSS